MILTFRWPCHLTLFLTTLSFCIEVLDFCDNFVISQWNYFIPTQMLLRSRPFHQHVASCPWPSDDLDIQHCSLTICVKVLFFSYNLFISWQIYFILTHNFALIVIKTAHSNKISKIINYSLVFAFTRDLSWWRLHLRLSKRKLVWQVRMMTSKFSPLSCTGYKAKWETF